jgi:DNA-binding transcriptional ArsR family regulator
MQRDKVSRARHGLSCISDKPSISERPPLAAQEAAELAAVFETLSNDTRLKVLNVMIQATETSPSELAERIGMKAQAISNQLKRLCDREIIVRRREGNQVYYRIADPCVIDLLERGLWLIRDTKIRKRARNGTLAAQIKFVETASLDRTEPRRAGPEMLGSKGPNSRNQRRRIKKKKKEL